MEDTFIIFYKRKILITLTGFKGSPFPPTENVLDWYGKNYGFEREQLTGCYSRSISVAEMKYQDFK